jgi:hypothetical protein
MRRVSVAVSGVAGTAYSAPVSGVLEGIYIDIGTEDNTIDFTITDTETGGAILALSNVAASAWYAPKIPVYTTGGAASLYAAAGAAVLAGLPISGSIKVVWAQGGSGHSATIYAFVRD